MSLLKTTICREILFCVVFLIIPRSVFSSVTEEQNADSVTITFVSNSGIIITHGDIKIAVDALTEGMHNSTHVDPSSNAVNEMHTCQGLFEDIDIILISHEHSDHFQADVVGKNMECNPQAITLCNEAVAQSMSNYENYEQIKDRIKISVPQEYGTITDTIHGIGIKTFRIKHATPMFSSIINLAFLIDINGYRIFHGGDSRGEYIEELEAYPLYEENINLAFLHIDFFNKGANENPEEGYKKEEKYIAADSIILIHNYPAYLNGGHDIIDALSTVTQNIFVFDNEYQTMSVKITPSSAEEPPKLTEQTVLFEKGWNLFSLCVEPMHWQIDSLFSDILPHIIAIKDFENSYLPGRKNFTNTLQTLEYGKAYFINMDQNGAFSISGILFSCEKNGQVSLGQGWNLLGMPYSESYFVSEFPDIIQNIVQIKDFDSFYKKDNPFSNLNTLTAGKGYLLEVNTPCLFYCNK